MASLMRNLVAGMSAREKKMAIGLAVAMFGFGVFIAVFIVNSWISELEEENAMNAASLELLRTAGPEYLERKLASAGSKIKTTTKPTPLRTLVDGVANKVDIPDPDTKELSDQRHGNAWIEHGVEVSIRGLGLEQLTKFMEEVEENRRKFPIAITKLEIRTRRRTQDEYDVKITISTYEKLEGAAQGKQKGAKQPRKGGH